MLDIEENSLQRKQIYRIMLHMGSNSQQHQHNHTLINAINLHQILDLESDSHQINNKHIIKPVLYLTNNPKPLLHKIIMRIINATKIFINKPELILGGIGRASFLLA